MAVTLIQPQIAVKDEEEWHRFRANGLGASEAAAVIGISPWCSNVELWRRKTGKSTAADISNNAAVAYGHNAEGPIRELFALDYPEYEVQYGGAFDMVFHPEHQFLFATLDGRLIERNTGRLGILEIKTTDILRSMQKEKWWSQDGPCIPDQYFCQICHQLLVTGFDFAILHAQLKFHYGDDIRTERRTYHIERAEVMDDIEYLKGEEIKFWEKVIKNEEPALILPEI